MEFEPTTLHVLDFFCVLLWLILYISLYFLYNTNISGISFKVCFILPYVRLSKTVLDSGFHIVMIPDSRY